MLLRYQTLKGKVLIKNLDFPDHSRQEMSKTLKCILNEISILQFRKYRHGDELNSGWLDFKGMNVRWELSTSSKTGNLSIQLSPELNDICHLLTSKKRQSCFP